MHLWKCGMHKLCCGDVASKSLPRGRHRELLRLTLELVFNFAMPWAQDLLASSNQTGEVSNDNDYKFLKWLDANGLNVPRDFKFAFTSAVGAANACPEAPMAAAEAWKAISHNEVEVSSSWTLWIKSRRCGNKLGAKQLSHPPVKLWCGFRTRKARADQGPANDSVRRRSAAKDALHVAPSWTSSGRLASEWCQLDPSNWDAWFIVCRSHA